MLKKSIHLFCCCNVVDQIILIFMFAQVHYRPTIYVAGFNKVNFSYNNVLMMSEWMIEKPQDLEENWYVTACPKGVRMLVVANQVRQINKFVNFTSFVRYPFTLKTSISLHSERTEYVCVCVCKELR